MSPHEHFDSLADDDLLRNIVQGCTDCFALLFHRYCRQVFSVSFRIIRDKAETEDILQEVFLSIFLQQERYDPSRGSIRTWILQFAYFKSLLRRRYLRIRHFYNDEELSETREMRWSETSSLMGMSSAEWAHYVETGIATLSIKQRRVIELVHFDGHTLNEASEILRESLANTRNLYYRGLKELKEFLNGRAALKKAEEAAVLGRRKDAFRFES
jgi:RNA polymerase sigma-70 factor (ECF subfamily)